MKTLKSIIIATAAGAALLASGTSGAFAQSIGVHFGSAGGNSGIHNDSLADSLLPTDMAGAAPYAQTNWNNLGRYGSVNTAVLTNSAGTAVSFALNWDAGGADTTGAAASLGTGDGKLMDGFLYSWGPGAATSLGNSVYNCSINNKPLVYISGLNSWYASEGAEGYGVVLYTTGYSYYEDAEGWIQAVSGNPFANTMVGGADLTAHVFEQDTGRFAGTYVQATGASSASHTSGANYMVFTGLTNDAVLIRCQSGGYGAGLNGLQFVPILPAPPTVTPPTFAPSSTVFAGVPTTLTEAATGDPFHPALYYQWQSDNAGGGLATNNILNATNATLTVTPTNNVSTYYIQYQVIVTNLFGASTSSVVTLTVNPAVAPYITQDTTPGAGNGAASVYAYVNGSVTFSAAFGGTPPFAYLWQSNLVNMPGATNATLTLTSLQLASTASYQLTVTNSIGGNNSTPASLIVLADPAAPTSSAAYPYDVFTNNPLAYWRLSESGDNVNNSIQAYDYSGHGYDATYGNAATDNQAGPQSPAFSGFEAGNTGVTLTHNANSSFLIAPPLNLNTNTVTITAWINPASTQAAYNGLLTWVNGADKAGFGFGGNSSGGMAELGYVWNTNSPATYNFHSGLYPLVGQWSFVALTITPTNSTIYLYYIDGNTGITNLLKAVQTINNLSEPFSGGTTWIGTDTSANRIFNGSLDEVAVFGKSLSEAQIQDLFLKAIGVAGIAPTVSSATASPSVQVYSGQNVLLSAVASGTVPLGLQWQAGPDSSTWTNVPGATASTLLVNPLAVGTIYYQLVATNPAGAATNTPVAVTFNALPASPAGLWTANFQVTNNILNYATGGGVGHYVGRGILGSGAYWNILPDTAGAFGFVARLDSVSDLKDDGTTHSGIYCSMFNASGFSSATAVLPFSSDIGNLLYQFVTISSAANALQFHGVPDGTYNLVIYACDGSFGDRGSTLVVHDSLNGDQTQSTVNAAPIAPLNQGVNFVLFNNVHVSGGTLNVDVGPNSPLPTHDPNTEADINAAQIQLVSYDATISGITLGASFARNTVTLSWPEGLLQTATNVTGPWTSIITPSPITLPYTNSARFFRLRTE